MTAREYTSATITIDGVRLEAPTMRWEHTSDVDTVARRFDAHRSEPVRVEFTIDGEAVARLFDEITREAADDWQRTTLREAFGAAGRGCFHEGCHDAMEYEGGERWCRWAT